MHIIIFFNYNFCFPYIQVNNKLDAIFSLKMITKSYFKWLHDYSARDCIFQLLLLRYYVQPMGFNVSDVFLFQGQVLRESFLHLSCCFGSHNYWSNLEIHVLRIDAHQPWIIHSVNCERKIKRYYINALYLVVILLW